MADAVPTLAQRVTAAMLEQDKATRGLGIVLIHAEPGGCCVEMNVREDMLNGFSTCHGGVLFSFADSAFGMACNSRNERTVAAAGRIDFLRPALPGDVLRASAVERSVGWRLGMYDVTLTNQRGETVALFRGKSCRVEGTIVDGTTIANDNASGSEVSSCR